MIHFDVTNEIARQHRNDLVREARNSRIRRSKVRRSRTAVTPAGS
jgi:hypothetical protein